MKERAPRTRRWVGPACLAAALALGYAGWHVRGLLRIGAAYEAKVLCSAVFVSGRDPGQVLREDLDRVPRFLPAEVDRGGGTVTVRFPGIPPSTAIYREGLGCTLLSGVAESDLRAQVRGTRTLSAAGPRIGSPASVPPGDAVLDEPDAGRLRAAVDGAFAEPHPKRPVRTRAVVVLWRGRVVAERYAEGITADTPLAGWSLAKSVTNALVGILVRQGKLDLHEPVPVPEWAGDARSRITLDELLRMTSGLAFDERSGPVLSDVNRMLLLTPDAAAYAAGKRLKHPPGTGWAYSSGTTNILSRAIRVAVGGSLADYWAFPRRELFDRIGMASTLLEPDASGTFVGSSFLYATARDLARLGLLYLREGVWEGQRILPEGWVAYTATPAPGSPEGRYGAHFWIYPKPLSPGEPKTGALPAAFYASGYEGQFVVVVPSRELVVVRLGNTPDEAAWDVEGFVRSVVAAIGG